MNDRFKFRLWDSDNDVFDYIDLTDIEETIRTLDSYENYFWSDYFKNEPEYIMQCTDLKDKNGKLIYEGDILKDKYGALHPISWNKKGFYEAETFAVAGFYNAIQEDMEVIGNIYENEDLLKCENQ